MATLAFADVLDRKTGTAPLDVLAPSAAPPPRHVSLWGAQAVWIYELASFGLAAMTRDAAGAAPVDVAPVVLDPPCGNPPVVPAGAPALDLGVDVPPLRILSSAACDALELLRSLGATQLRDDFNHLDIKRAYRHLALALHPDRHMMATSEERLQLAQTFVTMTAAIDCLLAVPDCINPRTKPV